MSVVTRAVAAETVRIRHTASEWIPLAGLGICILQGLGWATASTQILRRWDQLLAWQSAYATGLCAPLAALLAALTIRREARARSGGTLWRPVGPKPVRFARFAVLTVPFLIFNLAVTAPIVMFGLVSGLQDPPVGRLILLGLTLWAGSLPLLALALAASQRLGIYVTVGAAVVWQVAGTLQAQSPYWWLQPWTWPVRAALPVLGIHPNGVAAGPGDPVFDIAVWPPLALSVGLAAAVLAFTLLVRPPSGGRTPRIVAETMAPRQLPGAQPTLQAAGLERVRFGRRQPLVAAFHSCRRLGLGWLGVTCAIAAVGCYIGWTSTGVRLLYGVVLLPAATCFAACRIMSTQTDALRLILARTRAHHWCAALFAILLLSWVCITLWVGLLCGRHMETTILTGTALGAALLTANLWLATRFGVAAALGTTLVGVVQSLIFGTTQYAESGFWFLGPWVWAYSADTIDRSLLASGCSLVALTVIWPAWISSVRRAARE